MALRFCGIGAMRCATTWTFACLQHHPDIAFPGGKQVHFWDKNQERGIDWYRNIFDPDSPVAEGEITPAYAILADETVANIQTFVPDLRVWFVMRDPVDRAWSSVRLHLRRHELDPARLDAAWFEKRITSNGIRRRSRYENTLDVWRKHFGPDSVLALPYDAAETAPGEFLAQIATHVGVDPAPFRSPTEALAAEIAGAKNVGYQLELPSELRELAEDFYADEIAWYQSQFPSAGVTG